MLAALVWMVGALPGGAHAQFRVDKHVYSETADAHADIAAALLTAQRSHKRVLLEFGGNWCGDCMLLNYYYQQATSAEILAHHYVVVHVDIGHMDHNLDIAAKYHVPITRGVPALAVLDAHGRLLYAEHEKEFEHATPQEVSAFLDKWKG